jgi:hypothetical protein
VCAAGAAATVTWQGVTNVRDNDWIGVYLRNDSANTDYLDYVYVTEVTRTHTHALTHIHT